MKKTAAFLKSLPGDGRRLLAFCYAAFLAASVLAGLLGFAADGVQRASGALRREQLTAADFELTDMAAGADGVYVSESADPRMTLHDVPTMVRRVSVRAHFLNMDPGEFCVFYKPRPGMTEFDARYRVWSHAESDGTYTFSLPAGRVYGLRIDPGIYADLRFTIDGVVLNEPQSFLRWFTPTRPWLLAFAAAPALAASVIEYIVSVVCFWRAKARKKEGA